MNIPKQTLKRLITRTSTLIASFIVLTGLSLSLTVPTLLAAAPAPNAPPGNVGNGTVEICDNASCTSVSGSGTSTTPPKGIADALSLVVKILGGLAGVVIVIMVMIGGIRYSSAGGDPQAVAGAKKMIMNAIIALLVFIFFGSILNYLVPGGVI